MSGIEIIQSLMQQASTQGSRSTALNPLGWMLAILASCLAACLGLKAPTWLMGILTAAFVVAVVTYLGCYIYLMRNNVDALRSEKFSLSKMALQQSRKGDDDQGLHEGAEVDDEAEPAALPAPDDREEG